MKQVKFDYSLDSLMKKRKWELDEKRRMQSQAKEKVLVFNREVECLLRDIAAVEQEIREAGKEETRLEPARFESLQGFLTATRNILDEKKTAAREAEAHHQRICDRVKELYLSVKTLEKHKMRKQADFEDKMRKRELKEADELWLMGSRET